MEVTPKLSREEYIARMRAEFEQTFGKIADAVNNAPAGRVISGSEEQVRDLLAVFREQAFNTALQMRVDAAEAAFSPSEGPIDRENQAKQGTSRVFRADNQRSRATQSASLVFKE